MALTVKNNIDIFTIYVVSTLHVMSKYILVNAVWKGFSIAELCGAPMVVMVVNNGERYVSSRETLLSEDP